MNDGFIVIILAGVILAITWAIMFANMMTFDDSQLPGRHDKILWLIAFVVMPPLAPVGFWLFKFSYRARLEAERNLDTLTTTMSPLVTSPGANPGTTSDS